LLDATWTRRDPETQGIAFIHHLAQGRDKKIRLERTANIDVFCNIEGGALWIERLRDPDGGLGSRELAFLSGVDWIHLRLQVQRARASRTEKRNILYRLDDHKRSHIFLSEKWNSISTRSESIGEKPIALSEQIVLCFAVAREWNLLRRASSNCHISEGRGALWRANQAWSCQFLEYCGQGASALAQKVHPNSFSMAFFVASLYTHSIELQDSLQIFQVTRLRFFAERNIRETRLRA
jgi:hypothetical protein